MPRRAARTIVDARRQIVDAICAEPLTAAELARRLRPRVVRRTVANHLRWLREQLPDQIAAQRTPQGLRYRCHGLPPHLLAAPLQHLDEVELAALVAARGLLQLPGGARGAWNGALAQAIDRVLVRSGLAGEAERMSPDSIQVSRFGVAEEPSDGFVACLTALICGDCLRFRYRPIGKAEHDVHALPLRLVSILGEWQLFGWADGKLKQYRLARMVPRDGSAVRRVRDRPAGAPVATPRAAVDDALACAFGATGSDRREDQRDVVLAVSPDALPHLQGRTWGTRQR